MNAPLQEERGRHYHMVPDTCCATVESSVRGLWRFSCYILRLQTRRNTVNAAAFVARKLALEALLRLHFMLVVRCLTLMEDRNSHTYDMNLTTSNTHKRYERLMSPVETIRTEEPPLPTQPVDSLQPVCLGISFLINGEKVNLHFERKLRVQLFLLEVQRLQLYCLKAWQLSMATGTKHLKKNDACAF